MSIDSSSHQPQEKEGAEDNDFIITKCFALALSLNQSTRTLHFIMSYRYQSI